MHIQSMLNRLRRKRSQGQATLEYALVLGIVSVSGIAALNALGAQIILLYASINAQLATIPGA